MNITIHAIGKINPVLQKLIFEYLKRLRILKLTIKECTNKTPIECVFKDLEKSFKIVLTEKGSNITSVEFSNFIFSLKEKTTSDIAFIIGGANGISDFLLNKANYKLSFGKMTYPHEFFRVLLVEQLYRAETIFLKHPYHK